MFPNRDHECDFTRSLRRSEATGTCHGHGRRTHLPPRRIEGLLEIGDEVFRTLETTREPHHARTDACRDQLVIGHLAMRRGRRVQAARTCVGDVRLDGCDPECRHELLRSRSSTRELEAHHTAAPLRQVLPCQLVGVIARQARVPHARDLWARAQELGGSHAVLAVLRHADMQALETQVEVEGVLGALDAAEVAHEL